MRPGRQAGERRHCGPKNHDSQQQEGAFSAHMHSLIPRLSFILNAALGLMR